MRAEDIVEVLEENWGRFHSELSENWPAFTREANEAVETLPAAPTLSQIEAALAALCQPLKQTAYGDRLGVLLTAPTP
jgi:hypothetical protein